jgi:hypothetical protein
MGRRQVFRCNAGIALMSIADPVRAIRHRPLKPSGGMQSNGHRGSCPAPVTAVGTMAEPKARALSAQGALARDRAFAKGGPPDIPPGRHYDPPRVAVWQ